MTDYIEVAMEHFIISVIAVNPSPPMTQFELEQVWLEVYAEKTVDHLLTN